VAQKKASIMTLPEGEMILLALNRRSAEFVNTPVTLTEEERDATELLRENLINAARDARSLTSTPDSLPVQFFYRGQLFLSEPFDFDDEVEIFWIHLVDPDQAGFEFDERGVPITASYDR
jgi:hypothetical protein